MTNAHISSPLVQVQCQRIWTDGEGYTQNAQVPTFYLARKGNSPAGIVADVKRMIPTVHTSSIALRDMTSGKVL